MPYIITTTPRSTHDQLVARIDGVDLPATRTAVATLDEALDLAIAKAARYVRGLPGGERTILNIRHLSADGGTVGPLPDGTVIEVRRVKKFSLGFEAGLLAVDHPDMWPMDDLLAKFNRTGRFSADPA